MEALLIKNTPESFAMFLVALEIPFRYSYGEYIIENTHDECKFKAFCIRKGMRLADIDAMEISITNI